MKTALLLLGLAVAAPGWAQPVSTPATQQVVGGIFGLSVPATYNFGNVALTGQNITGRNPSSAFTWVLNDRTGDGNGWRLAIRGSNFSRTGGPSLVGTGLVTSIPIGNLSLNSTGTVLNNTGNVFWTSNAYVPPGQFNNLSLTTSNAVIIQTTAPGQGIGRVFVNFPASAMSLNLPYNLAAGSYTSTLTLTVTDL